MKKLWLVSVLFGVWLCTFAGAQIMPPWNIPITTTTWTAVTASHSAVSFLVQTRGTNSWKFSNSSGGTPYVTVANGVGLSFDLNCPKNGIVFYVQSVTSSDTLEMFVLR